jgi:hypothetical protein
MPRCWRPTACPTLPRCCGRSRAAYGAVS